MRSRHLRPTWKLNNRHSSMYFLCCSNVTLSHRPLLATCQILELPSLLAMHVRYAHSVIRHMRWLLATSLTKLGARHSKEAPLSYRHMVTDSNSKQRFSAFERTIYSKTRAWGRSTLGSARRNRQGSLHGSNIFSVMGQRP